MRTNFQWIISNSVLGGQITPINPAMFFFRWNWELQNSSLNFLHLFPTFALLLNKIILTYLYKKKTPNPDNTKSSSFSHHNDITSHHKSYNKTNFPIEDPLSFSPYTFILRSKHFKNQTFRKTFLFEQMSTFRA